MPGKNKLSKKRRKWSYGDWTLPGYKYLGPGNSLDKGPPNNHNDAVALEHDVAYRDIEDKGGDPYTMWNEADQKFLDNTKFTDYGGVLGAAFFGGKRKARDWGFIDEWRGDGANKWQRYTREDEPLPFDGNFQAQSLLNLQENAEDSRLTTAMSGRDGDGSGNDAGLKETPIDPIRNRVVERGPPEWVFASLPYVRDTTQSVTLWSRDISFRMTSPYDPQISDAASLDLNAGTGSAVVVSQNIDPDSAITSARWFDYYASLYNYYHTKAARWHMTIENMKTEPLWCHQLYYADEIPPLGATNEDMMCWKDCHSYLIGAAANAVSTTGVILSNQVNTNQNNIEGNGTAGNTANYAAGDMVAARGKSPILTLSGSYKTGDFNRQIRLDSEVENWTAVTTNPSLPERLLFRFRPVWNGLDTNDAATYDRLMKFRITFRIDYLVEFKELKTGLRWPVERQPLVGVITTNIEEDEE